MWRCDSIPGGKRLGNLCEMRSGRWRPIEASKFHCPMSDCSRMTWRSIPLDYRGNYLKKIRALVGTTEGTKEKISYCSALLRSTIRRKSVHCELGG